MDSDVLSDLICELAYVFQLITDEKTANEACDYIKQIIDLFFESIYFFDIPLDFDFYNHFSNIISPVIEKIQNIPNNILKLLVSKAYENNFTISILNYSLSSDIFRVVNVLKELFSLDILYSGFNHADIVIYCFKTLFGYISSLKMCACLNNSEHCEVFSTVEPLILVMKNRFGSKAFSDPDLLVLRTATCNWQHILPQYSLDFIAKHFGENYIQNYMHLKKVNIDVQFHTKITPDLELYKPILSIIEGLLETPFFFFVAPSNDKRSFPTTSPSYTENEIHNKLGKLMKLHCPHHYVFAHYDSYRFSRFCIHDVEECPFCSGKGFYNDRGSIVFNTNAPLEYNYLETLYNMDPFEFQILRLIEIASNIISNSNILGLSSFFIFTLKCICMILYPDSPTEISMEATIRIIIESLRSLLSITKNLPSTDIDMNNHSICSFFSSCMELSTANMDEKIPSILFDNIFAAIQYKQDIFYPITHGSLLRLFTFNYELRRELPVIYAFLKFGKGFNKIQAFSNSPSIIRNTDLMMDNIDDELDEIMENRALLIEKKNQFYSYWDNVEYFLYITSCHNSFVRTISQLPGSMVFSTNSNDFYNCIENYSPSIDFHYYFYFLNNHSGISYSKNYVPIINKNSESTFIKEILCSNPRFIFHKLLSLTVIPSIADSISKIPNVISQSYDHAKCINDYLKSGFDSNELQIALEKLLYFVYNHPEYTKMAESIIKYYQHSTKSGYPKFSITEKHSLDSFIAYSSKKFVNYSYFHIPLILDVLEDPKNTCFSFVSFATSLIHSLHPNPNISTNLLEIIATFPGAHFLFTKLSLYKIGCDPEISLSKLIQEYEDKNYILITKAESDILNFLKTLSSQPASLIDNCMQKLNMN